MSNSVDVNNSEVAARRFHLCGWLSVVAMWLVGDIAMMSQWIREGWLRNWTTPHDPLLTLVMTGLIGALCGALIAPVYMSLWRKKIGHALVVVFLPVAATASIYVFVKSNSLLGPLSFALPAIAAELVMIGIAHLVLADVKTLEQTEKCGQCGYLMTGNVSGICPECGRNRTNAKERINSPPTTRLNGNES